MRKVMRGAVVFVVALALIGTVPVEAAKPTSGTLGATKKSLSWKGGPYDMSYPTTDVACLDGPSDANCDHFLLKLNMGEGAKVNVAIGCPASGLEAIQAADLPAPNDFDLFVFNPAGAEVAHVGNFTCREALTFTHKAKYRNKPYEVRVVPYLVIPGTGYKGAAKIVKFVK